MRRWTLGTVVGATLTFVAIGAGAWILENEVAPRGAGYHAKVLCSGVFVAGRDAGVVRDIDLGRFWYVQGEVDEQARTVTSTLYGFGTTTAAYRPGLGCTLVHGTTVEALRADAPAVPPPRDTAGLPWPTGDVAAVDDDPEGVDQQALGAAVERAFSEPDPSALRRTRAVVVVHRGRIVAERYGPGFDAETPLLGWSMTKSVTSTLLGLAAERGRFDRDAPTGLDVWPEDDPRADLTADVLLRMSSGLAFDESYDAFGDATAMLFTVPSAWRYAASFPLEHDPGTHWSYSSATTNLLQAVLRDRVGEDGYAAFPRTALFDPLGMRTAVIEPDASGVFVGSSFMYASARDWARFGLLHLQDGVWEGERLLPEGWVTYATTPTPPSDGLYGAQWWLNRGAEPRWEGVPADAYDASGFEGQNVLVVPSRDAVIVRLGLTPGRANWDFGAFAAEVLAALPEGGVEAREAVGTAVSAEPIDDAAWVHRGDDPGALDSAPILAEDWATVIAARDDLSGPPTGAVTWSGHPRGHAVTLALTDGMIRVEQPDAATVPLLLDLADALDARVTAEHGARLVADEADPRGFRETR